MQAAFKKPLIWLIVSFLAIMILLLIVYFFAPPYKEEPIGYYMKSINNTVALYRGEQIIKIYDGIVVDTLPTADRSRLKEGIYYETVESADIAAEDYDG